MSNNKLILGILACSTLPLFAEGLFWSGPELETIKWESRKILPCDINADGRNDLALINGVERSIDIFTQTEGLKVVSRPNGKLDQPLNVLTRFEKDRIATTSAPSDFIFGDFDADGKLDMAYTSVREGVVFMERGSDGNWSVTGRLGDIKVTAFDHAMWVGNLDGSSDKTKVPTLFVLTEGQLVAIQNRQVVARYGCLRNDASYLTMTDLNGDGLPDVVYEYPSPAGIAYRLQTSDHRFDAEEIMSYDTDNECFFGNDGARFYFFGGKSATVEERVLVTDPLGMARAVYANATSITDSCWADLDGNGVDELVTVDGSGAQACVWTATASGGMTSSENFPTLKGVETLANLGQGAVAFFSPDEKAVGVSHYVASEHRLEFPQLLEIAAEPVGLLGVGTRAWVVERSNKDYFVRPFEKGALSKSAFRLEGIKRAPDAWVAYGDASGPVLLLAYQGRDQAQGFVLGENDARPVKITDALARANFSGIDPLKAGWIRLGGKSFLALSQKNSFRLFAFDGERLTLADQTLPVSGDVSLRLPFVDTGKLWGYDGRNKRWVAFVRDDQGTWAPKFFYDALPFDPQKILEGAHTFVAVGTQAFGLYAPDKAGEKFQSQRRFESKLDLDGYNNASIETLAPDGKSALLYNQEKHILEIVRLSDMTSLSNFELYEADPHYTGRKGEDVEPREFIAADVTGDGKADLVMLMHDKLAVYPRQ
jgi:hypothetical protein